jgi:hypothetical protein
MCLQTVLNLNVYKLGGDWTLHNRSEFVRANSVRTYSRCVEEQSSKMIAAYAEREEQSAKPHSWGFSMWRLKPSPREADKQG